ncbi:MAG: excisionase family DNA-binding protein [Candidatus Omnitrophica bacterium]|nr:excisionase family DNA-binding protein [Candidatus Omnitrophota bacterium]
MQPDYLTTSETAKIFHVTRFTVLNWVKKNKIQSVSTLGGHQRIPRAAVLELLKKSHSNDQAPVAAKEYAGASVPVELPAGALLEIASRSKENVPVGEFLEKQKNKFGGFIKEGAFLSGKYIAAFGHKIASKAGSAKLLK